LHEVRARKMAPGAQGSGMRPACGKVTVYHCALRIAGIFFAEFAWSLPLGIESINLHLRRFLGEPRALTIQPQFRGPNGVGHPMKSGGFGAF